MCARAACPSRLLVAAIPDALAVRTVVAYARRVNPTLDIVVRTLPGRWRTLARPSP